MRLYNQPMLNKNRKIRKSKERKAKWEIKICLQVIENIPRVESY